MFHRTNQPSVGYHETIKIVLLSFGGKLIHRQPPYHQPSTLCRHPHRPFRRRYLHIISSAKFNIFFVHFISTSFPHVEHTQVSGVHRIMLYVSSVYIIMISFSRRGKLKVFKF